MRVAPLSDARTDDQRLTLLKQAVAMAGADSERILALDRARAIRKFPRYSHDHRRSPIFLNPDLLLIRQSLRLYSKIILLVFHGH